MPTDRSPSLLPPPLTVQHRDERPWPANMIMCRRCGTAVPLHEWLIHNGEAGQCGNPIVQR